MRFLTRRRVHEEHGARAAGGALAAEGAAVLPDALAVAGLPASDLSRSSPATDRKQVRGRAADCPTCQRPGREES